VSVLADLIDAVVETDADRVARHLAPRVRVGAPFSDVAPVGEFRGGGEPEVRAAISALGRWADGELTLLSRVVDGDHAVLELARDGPDGDPATVVLNAPGGRVRELRIYLVPAAS
jgi:hypothetical protein